VARGFGSRPYPLAPGGEAHASFLFTFTLSACSSKSSFGATVGTPSQKSPKYLGRRKRVCNLYPLHPPPSQTPRPRERKRKPVCLFAFPFRLPRAVIPTRHRRSRFLIFARNRPPPHRHPARVHDRPIGQGTLPCLAFKIQRGEESRGAPGRNFPPSIGRVFTLLFRPDV
jgi:hypothetical protein